MTTSTPMTTAQATDIINKVVPLIAAPEDQEFFKGVLHVRAEACADIAEFGSVIKMLLAA